MSVLARLEIEKLLARQPPLLEGYTNLKEQLQPNGFDLTLRDIAVPQTAGRIEVANSRRLVSTLETLKFDESGCLEIGYGAYIITFNEIVHLPNNVMAIGKPRSSLLRCGVTIHNAVWDAGYSGRSQALLVVYNNHGFRIQQNARVLQLVFLTLTSQTEGYQGIYQGENTQY